MRPRQACLGIPTTTRRYRSVRVRFNEAEASLPRNPTSPICSVSFLSISFNEAEASLPRNPL